MTDDQAMTELRARCADLQSGIERATKKLRAALLAGECTSALRVRLDDLSRELTEAQVEFAAATESVIDARERRQSAEADAMVREVARRVKAMSAALAPPPAPLGYVQ